ncbi:hypothetical protein J8J40_27420, partial [Mycobacterium tuberculosis]|nr:hypothetical protein [Mycobacterium tuberculosis]
AWAVYKQDSDRIRAAAAAGKSSEAGRAFLDAIDEFNTALAFVQDGVALNDKGAKAAIGSQAELADASVFWVSVSSAIGILIAIAAMIYVA